VCVRVLVGVCVCTLAGSISTWAHEGNWAASPCCAWVWCSLALLPLRRAEGKGLGRVMQ